MSFKINPFTGNFDYYKDSFKGVLSSDPSDPQAGWTYINALSGEYLIYWGSWQVLATLTPPTPTTEDYYASMFGLFANVN